MSTLDAAWAPLGAVLVALVSGLIAWLTARRKSSGTVKTSEATEIWKANSEFRSMLIEEARARSAENLALRQEAAECHKQQAELEKRIRDLEKQVTNGGRAQG